MYYVRRKRKIGTILYAFIIESIVRQWLRTGKFPLQFGSCHPLLLPSYFLLFQANDFYRQSHDYHMYTNLLEAICLFLPLLKKPLPFLTYSRECLHFYARVNIKKEGEGPTNIGVIRSHLLSAKTSNNDKYIIEYCSHTLIFCHILTRFRFGGMFVL